MATKDPAAPGEVVYAAVSDTPLDVNTAWDAVESERTGAVVTFGGIVRNHDGGKEVVKLAYSAHPSANARMLELVAEVASRHPGTRLWAAHRVGELQIGDAALVAAAAAAHRGEAFEACRDLVETVKTHVPVWKEQFFADGHVEWVGSA
ncbi:molybdenum cofactor biosynthesis protein MoaE [Paeniglutamicibacter kerguelensis]|uniref:Molybdopterin synthase catalytic subunit n=1 Tax=Paeniglutamicibacter kerguelensis TaxID=254788 RepID=A0ABS4X9Y5_9MICC|nr:molybdenum cofactor biosynthesis protein MoaE [Paeniglutamicibacter kerguelensis]MBP2385186.1 molybdopterin synthase catalytic subunit [Paeniglutamicibacter kerguelensis]